MVLANIFQKSAAVWIVRKGSGITGIHDLVGKRVMHNPGYSSELLAMLQVEGIPANKINLRPTSFNIQDLIDDNIDAFNGYTTNEPYILQEQGIPYWLISPISYGVDSYGDALFTSESEIENHPERAKSFLQASLKGWQYAMDHPDEIIELIRTKYDSKKSRPHLKFEAEAMRDLILPDLVAIGHINPGRWRVIAEKLVALGYIEANYGFLEGFIYEPYPKHQDNKQLYIIIALVTFLALLFLGLAIWVGRLNVLLKKNEHQIRESELNLNKAQSISHIGSWKWDIPNNAITWSDELCQIYGVEPGEIEPSFEFFLGLLSEDTKKRVTDAVDQALAGLAEYDIEFKMIVNNGEERYVRAQAVIERKIDGEPLRMIGTSHDITELKHANEEKEFLQRELQQSQKMEALGKLTGGIAHEYNNMLAITIGFAALLEKALIEEPKLSKYAYEIIQAGNRGAKLTSKLLTFSRQDITEAASLNINTVLQKQHHMLEKTLTVRINLVFKLQENPWLVWIDEGNMEDAILNMSINAMHAIKGNGQLTIQTHNQKINQMDAESLNITAGDYVLLSFTDTGCGIDKEIKEKIFDPFFTTKGVLGTGLGLSMVYGFVQNSGGVIKVYSEQGEGTQFTFYFPRYNVASPDEQREKENNTEEIFIGNKTILVVDDEPALLDLTHEILSDHGFNVICAERAKDALNILEHESIDILLSDIIMPEMDGYQLAAVVKEKYPDIKIQLASGFTDVRNMDIVDESLRNNLLQKPFNSQALLQRIRELCDEN